MDAWQSIVAEASENSALLVVAWFLLCVMMTRALARDRVVKLRASPFLFSGFIVLLPVSGLMRAQGAVHYGAVHALTLLCGAQACVLALGGLLFHGVLPRLRARIPRILEDVTIAAAAGLTALAVASRVGVNLSGLIATSAVLTAVVGFSLQDTLGNVMGGLFLQIDNSVAVGDWVKIDALAGRVVEIRWRYTAVETSNGETAIIPNSALMKTQVLIIGRRAAESKQQRRSVFFNVDFRRPPTQVIDAVEGALVGRKIHNVSENPPPSVILVELADSYARYAARYWLTDLTADSSTDSMVRSFVYFALKRAGLELAVPASAQFVIEHSSETKEGQLREELAARVAAVSRVDIFSGLSEEERDQLAQCLHPAPFAKGEVITRQGTEAHWLYLITEGTVSIRLGAAGLEKEVAKLGPGDFFGEMGLLTGKPRSTTVVALSEVKSFRLGKPAFEEIIARRPDLADSLAEILSTRRAELVTAREGLDGEAAARRLAADKKDLVSSIRRFFNLPQTALSK